MSTSYISEEIILNILSRLQVKTLFRFRCVCKSWCNLLTSNNNHDLVKMHLNHALNEMNNNSCSLILNWCDDFYLIDSVLSSSSSSDLCYEAVKFDKPFKSRLAFDVSDSCNGLLCYTTNFRNTFFIYNPSTKEYKELSPKTVKSRNHYVAHGFAYDCKIDDYKFVQILSHTSVEVNVYTLGLNSWRNVQSIPHSPFSGNQCAGVFLYGALHWINENIRCKVIVSFDIGDERFQEIVLPNCLVHMRTSKLSVLRGDLCILSYMRDATTDVWVMKDYGGLESWTKLFSIAQDNSIFYLRPIHSFKNGEILFWVQLKKENSSSNTDALVLYDSKHERTRTLKIQGIERFWNIRTYVKTLVSPN